MLYANVDLTRIAAHYVEALNGSVSIRNSTSCIYRLVALLSLMLHPCCILMVCIPWCISLYCPLLHFHSSLWSPVTWSPEQKKLVETPEKRPAKQTQQHHHSVQNMTGESENLQRIFNKHNVPIYFKPFSTLELLHPEDLTPKHKAILYMQFGAMKNALTCTSTKQSNCCISALKGKTLRADYRWFKWAVKKER